MGVLCNDITHIQWVSLWNSARQQPLLTLAGVFLIAFMKGAFGGGFAIISIPLLALVMDPLTAGALLAPLFVAMDLFALQYWRPSTWSKPDLKVLLPSTDIGYWPWLRVALRILDARAAAISNGLDHACIYAAVVSRRRRG